jgi:hypothetical protein
MNCEGAGREKYLKAAESDESLLSEPFAYVLLSTHILIYIFHGTRAFLRC